MHLAFAIDECGILDYDGESLTGAAANARGIQRVLDRWSEPVVQIEQNDQMQLFEEFLRWGRMCSKSRIAVV